MKRFVKTFAAVGVILGVAAMALTPQVSADSVERKWTSPEDIQPKKPTGFFNSLLPAKPTAKLNPPVTTQVIAEKPEIKPIARTCPKHNKLLWTQRIGECSSPKH